MAAKGTIALGSDTNVGGRRYNEDRCAEARFSTRGGLELSVAIVCDGVGGAERGERAAQLAIDALLEALKLSDETDVPKLLTASIRTANAAVMAESRRLDEGEQMACTLAMAVIVNAETLFVANVGDSRVYLSRDGQLQQLTRDHTFENVMVWLGKLSPEAAASNPDANKVMRVLGTKENLQVDQGVYLTTTEYGEANRLGRQGFPLRTGDSLVVCSDGLIKLAPSTGQRLVTDAEIVTLLSTYEGPAAARAIMGKALGRIPVGDAVDNISLALLQTEDPKRAANFAAAQRKVESAQRKRMVFVAAGVGGPLILVVLALVSALGWLFIVNRQQNAGTATRLAEVTEIAAAQTMTVAAYTPTPTDIPPTATPRPTAVPTLIPGELGKLFSTGEMVQVVTSDGKILSAPEGQTRFLAINHTGANQNGEIYATSGSKLQLRSAASDGADLRLLNGSQIVVRSGPYPLMDIDIGTTAAAVRVASGCLAVTYIEPTAVILECLDGTCDFSTQFGSDYVNLPAGQRVRIDTQSLEVDGPTVIQASDVYTKYYALLQSYSSGVKAREACNVPAPTATPTRTVPRPTATLPATATAPSVSTSNNNTGPNTGGPPPAATSTPRPPATATPRPPATTRVPTNTPVPTATSTVPAAPTSTRTALPTATPTDVATDTPVPPTLTRTLPPPTFTRTNPPPTPTRTTPPDTDTPTSPPPPTSTDTPPPPPTSTDTPPPPPPTDTQAPPSPTPG